MTLIQVRRGSAAAWTASNPVLGDGEPACEDDTGLLKIGNGTDAWAALPYVTDAIAALVGVEMARAEAAEGAIIPDVVSTFNIVGPVTVLAGTNRFYNDTGHALTIKKVRASVVTAPTGATLIVDVNLVGTTIFTTAGNRPEIAISANTATGIPDVTAWPDGEYLTVDVDQIGSVITGSDLTVIITA